MKPIEPPMPDLSTPVHHKNPNSPIEVSIKIFLAIAGLILLILGSIYAYTLVMENQIRPSEYESFKYLPTTQTPNKTLITPPASDTEMASWKTYTNNGFRFSLLYPSDWSLTEDQYQISIRSPKILEDSRIVYSSSPILRAEFQIVMTPQSTTVTMEKLREYTVSGDTLEISKKTETVMQGNPAIIYQAQGGSSIEKDMKGLNVGLPNGLLRILLKNYSMNQQDQQLLDQILSTLIFIDQSPSPTCRPRPACLDSTPRCLIPETPDMCPPSIACTQDAKLCPDGSYVSRQGPNCEFAPCPNL